MRKALERCPACGEQLNVTQLSCSHCDIVVKGTFELCTFCRLSAENLGFLEAFVRNRGNLKEMERELGQSYPALRNRLNAVIAELGFESAAPEVEEVAPSGRREILDQLDRGEISASEAVERLSRLREPT